MVNGLFLRSIVKEVAANDYYIPCFSHYREGHGNKKKKCMILCYKKTRPENFYPNAYR